MHAGVGVLIEVCECLAGESRRLRLTEVPAFLRRLFELVGVCDQVSLEPQTPTLSTFTRERVLADRYTHPEPIGSRCS